MTPDEFLSTLHRQRTDIAAMRAALEELAKCLHPDVRDGWLQALQTRIAKGREAAKAMPQEQAVEVLALVQATSRLRTQLEAVGMSTPDDDD